jgi:DNA-binding NtrC family response regulator
VAPSELIERLFGSEQVSPGGARERRPGLVENGAGGTIYFHELGDLPLELQPALLKLLESGTFRRVGGVRDLQADVRIMAGSSRPLAALVEGDIIGEDLGYRLNAMPVTIPPVRSRHRDDRLTLLMTVADRLRDGAPDAPPDFTADALDRLVAHSWPGNVTEMGQVLGRALLLAREAEAVGLEHLPGELRNRAGPGDRRHTPMTLDALERSHIERTLRHHGGNRTKAAQELGISRATLINKIKRYSLER